MNMGIFPANDDTFISTYSNLSSLNSDHGVVSRTEQEYISPSSSAQGILRNFIIFRLSEFRVISDGNTFPSIEP